MSDIQNFVSSDSIRHRVSENQTLWYVQLVSEIRTSKFERTYNLNSQNTLLQLGQIITGLFITWQFTAVPFSLHLHCHFLEMAKVKNWQGIAMNCLGMTVECWNWNVPIRNNADYRTEGSFNFGCEIVWLLSEIETWQMSEIETTKLSHFGNLES